MLASDLAPSLKLRRSEPSSRSSSEVLAVGESSVRDLRLSRNEDSFPIHAFREWPSVWTPYRATNFGNVTEKSFHTLPATLFASQAPP